jgi:hypothetical protein
VIENFITEILLRLKLDLAVFEPKVAKLLPNDLHFLWRTELNPGKSWSNLIQGHLEFRL